MSTLKGVDCPTELQNLQSVTREFVIIEGT
jgi:hypothetical protein